MIAVLFLNDKNYLWLVPCVFFFNFIYLFLAVLGLLLHGLFSSCGQRGPHSSFGVWTFAAERGLWSTRASVVASGSVVVAHGLGCPTACGGLVP